MGCVKLLLRLLSFGGARLGFGAVEGRGRGEEQGRRVPKSVGCVRLVDVRCCWVCAAAKCVLLAVRWCSRQGWRRGAVELVCEVWVGGGALVGWILRMGSSVRGVGL